MHDKYQCFLWIEFILLFEYLSEVCLDQNVLNISINNNKTVNNDRAVNQILILSHLFLFQFYSTLLCFSAWNVCKWTAGNHLIKRKIEGG